MDNLNNKQIEAVQHGQGPLLIAAGAGSGKTKTLVSRLLHLLKQGVQPEKIIAITFTNKAAKEMRNRVSASGEKNIQDLFVGTFHSFGVKILKNEAVHFQRTKNFTIFDDDDSLSLVKKILKEKDLSKDRYNPINILGKISNIKSELVNPENISPVRNREGSQRASVSNGVNLETAQDAKILEIFYEYENKLKKSNAFDFDDLITKTVGVLSKKEVLEKYQNQYEYILVDEYQDINTAQYQLIKLLSEKTQNIFAIGDDAQSIYKFRGSDFRNFLNFERDWPKAKIIKLEQNYRSTGIIISASSALIKNNKQQKPKELWTENKAGEDIKIFAYMSAEEEAWGICEKIIGLVREGEPLNNNAILYRTNAQSRALEQALIQNKIPYEIYGGLKFYARKEIKDLIAGLRYAYNPSDAASIERIDKNFNKSKSKIIFERLPELSKELTMVQIINFFMENTDYASYLVKNFKNPSERMENIKELINFASQYDDPYKFLEEVSLMSASDGKPSASRRILKNSIKLMTIHAAKGLEFENVFLIGCNEGLLPHEQSLFKADEIEEERRLMYVAMTRAKNKLFVSFYGLPSRFLGELPGDLISFVKVSSYGERDADWDDETIYIE